MTTVVLTSTNDSSSSAPISDRNQDVFVDEGQVRAQVSPSQPEPLILWI